MRRLTLTPDTRAVLARLRAHGYPLCVYGWSAARARLMVKDLVRQRVDHFGVAVHERGMYNRYADQMLKAFRIHTREPLVHALEQAIRKWANLGLKPELLQLILCDCHLRFHNKGYQMKLKRRLVHRAKPGPKPRPKRRPTYKQMLKRHRVKLAAKTTVEVQSARHHTGTRHAQDIGFRLRGLLDARRVPTDMFGDYFAFAQKLGRLSRKYADKSLQLAASDLIDLYEFESLDSDTLRSIAVTLFGVLELR
jgi:hypothetical protein